MVVWTGASLAGELTVNGGFEDGLRGWYPLWTRERGKGKATIETKVVHSGRRAARIEHTGSLDWSFGQVKPLAVEPGQLYRLRAFVRLEGQGNATLGVILRDRRERVLSWAHGARTTRATRGGWRLLESRFIIPPGGATILPRLIGRGPATVWLDDFSLTPEGTMDALRRKDLPETLEASNAHLHLTLHCASGALDITDRRSGTTWRQRRGGASLAVLDARAVPGGFDLDLFDPRAGSKVACAIRLDDDRPELTVELRGEGRMPNDIAFPPPLQTAKGMLLIMPVNEGISYPVDDRSLRPMWYHLYGGHGLCMGWYGVTDGQRALMFIVETPDDAAVRVPRLDGLLTLAPIWQAQKGQFGYPRRLRLVAFERGGYVAMCKRYRQHAKKIGLFKTLAEKRKANPNVDLLIGAVNIWCWDRDPVGLCRELQQAGIERILWSHRASPEQIRAMNKMGILTSRYDIYQDAMNPANFPKLRGIHPDWTSEAWANDDIMVDANGDWVRGWRVRAKNGEMIPCGVLCDRRAVDYARRRIPPELETHPYRCRFIDTTTASPWRECYNPKHPMTRSESKHWKMQLLRYVSEECGLVCGSETGHEAAVPYVHYFEGMLSLGPYRVPDAGRNIGRIVDEVPERVAKFQTGHYYRLPLWELVYHDCVVAQWYWGDYNNKLPALWDRRDLWNALYGTPPMFMFNRQLWRRWRERFVQSYRTAAPVARATGYSEMLSHEWLTPDHAVQRTRFANGVVVTVNFGDKPHTLPDGTTLPPLGHRVDGLPGN